MDNLERLKQFVFNAILLDDSFRLLEKEGIAVGPAIGEKSEDVIADLDYSPRILHSADRMSVVYSSFFCLENSVRELIADRLAERRGIDWWQECVPGKIRVDVEKLKKQEEKRRYHTQRSTQLLGYTMFGNLAQIIISNWEDFSDLLPDQAWVTARFNDLEMSRNIIMHTGILPEIEIERIASIARDWVRQVG